MIDKNEHSDWFNLSEPGELRLGLSIEAMGCYRSQTHRLDWIKRDQYLLIYCVAGQGYFESGGKSYPIKAGEVFFGLPDLAHRYACDPATGWNIWWIHFRGDIGERLMALLEVEPKRLHKRIGHQTKLMDLFNKIEMLFRLKPVHYGLDASGLLIQLLLTLHKIASVTQPGEQDWSQLLSLTQLSGLDQMAAGAGISKYHFIRKFQKATGLTPWQYVLNRRLSRAKELLAGTELPIKQIAIELGFSDPNYFSRLFCKYTGIPATEFRKQCR